MLGRVEEPRHHAPIQADVARRLRLIYFPDCSIVCKVKVIATGPKYRPFNLVIGYHVTVIIIQREFSVVAAVKLCLLLQVVTRANANIQHGLVGGLSHFARTLTILNAKYPIFQKTLVIKEGATAVAIK